MAKTKVALTIDSALLDRVDDLVARARFRTRSQAVETAVAEMLTRLARTRLADECAKLDPVEERGFADEGSGTGSSRGPTAAGVLSRRAKPGIS